MMATRHKMSLVGARSGGGGQGSPMSDVFWGGLYSEFQCIMVNDHMGTPCEQTNGHK